MSSTNFTWSILNTLSQLSQAILRSKFYKIPIELTKSLSDDLILKKCFRDGTLTWMYVKLQIFKRIGHIFINTFINISTQESSRADPLSLSVLLKSLLFQQPEHGFKKSWNNAWISDQKRWPKPYLNIRHMIIKLNFSKTAN